jgi:hypothetical protein
MDQNLSQFISNVAVKPIKGVPNWFAVTFQVKGTDRRLDFEGEETAELFALILRTPILGVSSAGDAAEAMLVAAAEQVTHYSDVFRLSDSLLELQRVLVTYRRAKNGA